MAESQITTESLAEELGCSERQVLNYKKTVEDFLGGSITRRQGKKHFYISKYVELLRMVSRFEMLPGDLQGALAPQEKQVSSPPSEARTVEIAASGHPSLEIQNSGRAIAPVTSTALFFTVESEQLQREGLRQETETLAGTTFQNIGGLQALLRFQLIEGFRQAAVVDVRDAVGAYHQEVTQGLGVVAKEAKKAGFGGCIDDSKSA